MSEQPFGGSSVRGTEERNRPAPSVLTEAEVCPEQFFLVTAAQNIKRLVRFLSQGPKSIMTTTT